MTAILKLWSKPVLFFTSGVITLTLALAMISPVFAEEKTCYGPYGQEIECPVVNKSFSVEKEVRKLNTNDWSESVNGTTDGDVVEFRMTVRNTGEYKVDELKVIDVLPENLTLQKDSVDNWVINDFEPQTEHTVTLKAVANTTNISENQEKCVVNVVNLTYNNHQEASDTATVCIHKEPKVLSQVTTLPETATGLNSLATLFVVFLSGLITLTASLAYIESRTK